MKCFSLPSVLWIGMSVTHSCCIGTTVCGFARSSAGTGSRRGPRREAALRAVDDGTFVDTVDGDESSLRFGGGGDGGVLLADRDLDPLIQRKLSLVHCQTDEYSSSAGDDVNTDNSAWMLLLQANRGLRVWRSCLLRGRLPVAEQDFFDHASSFWPPEPLFTRISQTLAHWQLPRLVLRHEELVDAVLSTLLAMVLEFQKVKEQGTRAVVTEEQEENADDDEFPSDTEDAWYWEEWTEDSENEDIEGENIDAFQPLSDKELEVLADELVSSGFVDAWGGTVEGISALDRLFGADHGLLLMNDETVGFGTDDGIWQHTGWKTLTQLQQEQLASMPELKQLLNRIGRRPTVQRSDAMHRFPPRRFDPDGGLGAQWDAQRRESVSGLSLSGSLTEMLPSEAVLLKGSPALRRLFLAKRVESKLLSYQMSGWFDTESSPQPEQRHLRNMPSASGGPIIVCLDTSWSMSGMRETLSKAVVVACVAAAHRQKRDCQVVAFSSAGGVMETGLLTADAAGVQRLLDFLSHSFGGGTDVTGALKHAMQTLGCSDEMAAADLLLVTDGEIPDPPVSPDMMDDLDRLKHRTGLQIHGLLVGKSESVPLSKLCTETHDFLFGYDTLSGVAEMGVGGYTRGPAARSALQSSPNKYSGSARSLLNVYWFHPGLVRSRWQTMGRCHGGCLPGLHAIARDFDSIAQMKEKVRRKGRYNGDDDDVDVWDMEHTEGGTFQRGDDESNGTLEHSDSFNDRVDQALDKLRKKVEAEMSQRQWCADDLEAELNSEYSCWKYKDELASAVDRICENLVEREEESRLVVLGLISREHVLLLGPPGTGKSALGRRLSKLCGGSFFQRLLTRFTTPEEIFGPLSLRALENDEYRRCTEGFLPTASVAFLDEIFKANSAILNTLLTILNERQFDNGAGQRELCQIRCVVGASNEMPESDELDALYDRFLIRKEVLSVSDEGIMRILSMTNPGVSVCDSVGEEKPNEDPCDLLFTQGLDNVVDELSVAAEQVTMGEDACILVRDLRRFMQDDLYVDVSDRRLVKGARLLKICAASHGRNRVDPLDCLLLQHIVWRLPEQRDAVRDWLWENMTPGGNTSPAGALSQFRLLLENLRKDALTIVRKTSGDVTGSAGALESDLSLVRALVTEIAGIGTVLQDRSTEMRRHIEILRRSMNHLWLSPDEARAAQQVLEPKAELRLGEIERALADAQGLEMLLKEGSGVENDLRLSVMEMLWEEGQETDTKFSDDELNMGMREAKTQYDLETFRKWKRARKKANK